MTRSHRVMIVEDEPNIRLVLRTALLSNDYVLSTAEDGETALRYLRQEPTDLVLLDLRMPNLDGLGLLRRLRADGHGVPVVILTAHGGDADRAAAMELGVVEFLTKPTTPEALRAVVAEAIARGEAPGAARLPTDDYTWSLGHSTAAER